MDTPPYQKEGQAGAQNIEAPRDDWLEGQGAVEAPGKQRFPLEWIEGNEPAKTPKTPGNGLHKQRALHKGWKPRQLVWTVVILAWMSGFVMGAAIIGTSLLMHYASMRKPTMADQMALTAGYRAMVFQARPVAR